MDKIFVGLGEVLWDMLPQGKVLGGAPANFAYYANQFSGNGIIVSAVGDDPLGNEILSDLQNIKMDTNYIQANSFPTGTVEVEFDSNNQPQYNIIENVAWDYVEMNSDLETLAKKTSAVSFGSLAQRSDIARNTINAFVKATPSACLKIFDINLRQHYYTKEIIDESLQQANILKINEAELLILAEILELENQSEKQILEQLINNYNLQLSVLTKGKKGCLICSNKGCFVSNCGVEVQVKDPVGAGDAFSAVVAYCVTQNMSLEKTACLANKVAGYVCTQTGATAILPDDLLSEFTESS